MSEAETPVEIVLNDAMWLLGETRGVQLCVWQHGKMVLDLAVGEDGVGRSLRPESIFALYCSTKPLLALVVAQLIEEGLLHEFTKLGDVLDVPRAIAQFDIVKLLTHSAGLHAFNAVAANIVPSADWPATVRSMAPSPSFRCGLDRAYAEFAGWELASEVVTAVSGRDWHELVAQWLIGPLNLSNDLFLPMPGTYFDTIALSRLGVNVDLRDESLAVPLLLERTRRVATQPNAAFGGYGNARGLAHLYARLLSAYTGGESKGTPSPAIVRRALIPAHRGYDFVAECVRAYSLAFIVDLREEFSPLCGPESFGYVGLSGMSCGFADPAAGLAVGLVINGVLEKAAGQALRRLIIEAAYRTVGGTIEHESECTSAC